jgi:hypothetical protein
MMAKALLRIRAAGAVAELLRRRLIVRATKISIDNPYLADPKRNDPRNARWIRFILACGNKAAGLSAGPEKCITETFPVHSRATPDFAGSVAAMFDRTASFCADDKH